MGDSRADQIKKPHTITSESSQDFEDFFKLLDLNYQLAAPKQLCVNTWCLLNES